MSEAAKQGGIRPAVDLVEKWEIEETVAPGLVVVLTLLS